METKLAIDSDIKNLSLIESKVDELIVQIGITKEEYGRILVATMEAVNNAIVHGNGGDRTKRVNICFAQEDDKLMVQVKDQGVGFNPDSVPDPTSPENIEKLRGRGVFLMKNLADEIDYNENGNEVLMKFKIEKIGAKDLL